MKITPKDIRQFLEDAAVGDVLSVPGCDVGVNSVRTVTSEWKRHNKKADRTFFTRTTNNEVGTVTQIFCAQRVPLMN